MGVGDWGVGPRSCGTRSRADWGLGNGDWGLGVGGWGLVVGKFLLTQRSQSPDRVGAGMG